MKSYKVYFEIGGKKLCKVVRGASENEAKAAVLNSVVFHKVRERTLQEVADDLFDIVGIKGKP